jgi:hypothetical protein
VDSFVDELPKVELRLHLVGPASVPTVLDAAAKQALLDEIDSVAARPCPA